MALRNLCQKENGHRIGYRMTTPDITDRLRRWTISIYAVPASDLMDEAADEIERLRLAVRRLADQDATLSVCDGAVTVTVDATLTDAEREAIKVAERDYADNDMDAGCYHIASTLRGLLERLK